MCRNIGALLFYEVKKILLIQTAFIGDVILATALLEKLHSHFPEGEIDFLLRKGNEALFDEHPYLNEVLIWDKKNKKYSGLYKLIKLIRNNKYDYVINLQRFFSTGLMTIFSGGKYTVGFNKNPLSIFFNKSVKHIIGTPENTVHEIERNIDLIKYFTDEQIFKPKLYPSENDFNKIKNDGKYICISPGSVWFTKQWPAEKWTGFIDRVGGGFEIYLLGGKSDFDLCKKIKTNSKNNSIHIMAGQLSFLESAALMKNAAMNYVNDSAPLHMASAVDAPVTAVFCSTVPYFGFTPLSADSAVLETAKKLACRPCGLHGKKTCPEGHFKCSDIEIKLLLDRLD
ncbi:MAG TPA: glycosyltransferase family 9 protein [Bacteroidetes bacterium]|nr:glycosyltransferase family 9 protein [Bacteroidota bacterium]